ncbi:uncharacterized protein AB675_7703 [Cyphellophora attinorum]|uniref:AB hydrolase-1 domain-containing protein n=1 Tax=Cyphellophora attinorum TaxID=1664694 RepID=A0A0N1P0L4_9EURO|nr:uncharacterized protein AB675_7703 [Phialophora attinorum]KPI40573.1 hypothetical protein AB675_7703 [Phialophora attinorum]
MGSLPPKPTIVWINGSFSPASFYTDVADGIRNRGYDIVVDTLPSSARTPPEKPATMEEDAAYFHDIVERLCDEGKDVVLAMHSYGGVVGSECSRGLSKAERTAAGQRGGITQLVFVTCVVPDVGVSLREVTASGSSPWLILREDGYMEHIAEESAGTSFSGLPHAEGVAWVKKMPLHSLASFEGKLTYAGYKHIPSSWIFCEQDIILPPDFQRSCIERIERESGRQVRVYRLAADHCPNASAPRELVKALDDAVADFEK